MVGNLGDLSPWVCCSESYCQGVGNLPSQTGIVGDTAGVDLFCQADFRGANSCDHDLYRDLSPTYVYTLCDRGSRLVLSLCRLLLVPLRSILPNYYFVYQHFGSTPAWLALLGNLLSPSRGLLVFVPVLFFVGYLLLRYWATLPMRRLVVLSLVVICVHLIVVSLHSPWYGGHCYGPRYSTGIVPWFYLLAVAGLQARRQSANEQTSRRQSIRRQLEASVGVLLLLLSVTINALGATSHATWLWNSRPVNVDQQPDRVWDWKHPQFLAPWDH